MTDETATGVFDLDAALESAYDQVTNPDAGSDDPAPSEENTVIAEGDKPEVKETTTSGTEDKPEAEKPIEAPVSWTAEAKEKFAKLPPDVQTYITQRESEREKLLTQKSTEFSEHQRKYEALEQILAPRRQALAASYGGEAQALNQLFQLSDFADRDPQGFVQWFAQQRGINLQNAQPVADDVYVDPVTQQLQQKLTSIEQKISTQEQAQIVARQETVRNEIAVFKDEKDEAGNLINPYFDEVKAEMASLMQTGAAKNLKHAYEMAQWANSTVRQKILESQTKAKDSERLDAAKEAAAKAEKAKGVTVKSKKAGESAPSKKGNWEETLDEKAGELYGAAS